MDTQHWVTIRYAWCNDTLQNWRVTLTQLVVISLSFLNGIWPNAGIIIQVIKTHMHRDSSGKKKMETSVEMLITAPCTVLHYHLYISSCKPGLLKYLLQLLMGAWCHYVHTSFCTLFATAIPTCFLLIYETFLFLYSLWLVGSLCC